MSALWHLVGDFFFPYYLFTFYLFCFLSNFYARHGAQTHDPQDRFCTLHRLRQPGAPVGDFFDLSFHVLYDKSWRQNFII